MTEYLRRDEVLSDADIITVQTKEYGTIEVVPVEYLADLPTADVVEVVRCKDCIHNLKGYCNHDFALNLNRDDCFCSYGKRRNKND